MNVLVVDDSVVFRSQIKAALESAALFTSIDTANNGKIALQKLQQKKYDMMTLDLEMPELDGIGTLKEMKGFDPKPRVIVFSAHSFAGGVKTMEALSSGADDFVPKPSGEGMNIGNAAEFISRILLPKVRQFLPEKSTPKSSSTALDKTSFLRKEIVTFRPNIVVIASSTGGPSALEAIFANFKSPRVPILIAQHMPPVFTKSLAARLTQISQFNFKEGEEGQVVEPGVAYIAPGDFHMRLAPRDGKVVIQLDQSSPRNHVRPAADYLFETAAQIYGEKALGVVLTGMGSDGLDGTIRIKELKGGVIIQDKESCTVFGMPGAVHSAGSYDDIGNLEHISRTLARML